MITFAFYLFAISVCTAGFMVVLSRNPVHSVLWLILAFIASAGLFVLQGAEFVAMLLVIVYVGAVAVLFLFVVMMLDVDFAQLRGELAGYLPLAGLIGLVLLALLVLSEGKFNPELLPWLLLLNPTDIYRLINLSGFEGSGSAMGVLSLGADLPVPAAMLWLCLLAWVGVSLLLAYGIFRRRLA